jgi:hypothetical protein
VRAKICVFISVCMCFLFEGKDVYARARVFALFKLAVIVSHTHPHTCDVCVSTGQLAYSCVVCEVISVNAFDYSHAIMLLLRLKKSRKYARISQTGDLAITQCSHERISVARNELCSCRA